MDNTFYRGMAPAELANLLSTGKLLDENGAGAFKTLSNDKGIAQFYQELNQGSLLKTKPSAVSKIAEEAGNTGHYIGRRLNLEDIESISDLSGKVTHDESAIAKLVAALKGSGKLAMLLGIMGSVPLQSAMMANDLSQTAGNETSNDYDEEFMKNTYSPTQLANLLKQKREGI